MSEDSGFLKTQARAAVWSAIATWVAALAALLALIIAWPLRKTATSIEGTRQDVKGIESALVSSRLVITSLRSGDTVSMNETVSGITPYPKRRHYLVVTPEKVGDSYVQDPASVKPDGTWTSNAQFGSGEVGVNERFMARCAATDGELKTGSIASQTIPQDIAWSLPVTVTRIR